MHNRDVVLKLSDFHIPFHDERAVKVAYSFARFLKPHTIVLDEVLDFYQLSKFDKTPSRVLEFGQDVEASRDALAALRKMCPASRIVMVRSNHDQRLERYTKNHPELSSLSLFTVPELLALRKLKIGYTESLSFRDVLFKHGSVVRKHSGYTARAEFEREGCSGVSGHSHRLGIHYVSLRGGKYCWLEGGCLCQTEGVEYIDGVANWQQGVTAFMFAKGSRHFHAQIYPIIDGQIMFGERTFEG